MKTKALKQKLIVFIACLFLTQFGFSQVRPDNFPTDTTITGSEHIYTQDGGSARKFLWSKAREYFSVADSAYLNFTPTNTGNTRGKNSIFSAADGNVWFVDFSGNGFNLSDSISVGAGSGDITAVTAGDGLQGGGTTGAVTLNATPAVNRGLVVISDSLAIKNQDFGDITVSGESWQIDADAVGSNEIAADAVGSSEIAANAVGSSEIATGEVGADEIAATAVTPGSYTFSSITVDADGRLTAASSGAEVDDSVTNEGSLSVGAGSGTTSTIVSNTSGSTAVTIEAGSGLSIAESGSTITLTNSQTGLTDGDKGDITVSASGATWNIDAGVIGPTELEATSVTPGDYTSADITIDADGRITAAASGAGGGGDITAVTAGDGLQGGGTSGAVTVNATPAVSRGLVIVTDSLAIKNQDFGDITVSGESWTIDAGAVGPDELASTAITPGTYGSGTVIPNITFDADGRATAGTNTAVTLSGDVTGTASSTSIASGVVGPTELENTAVTPASYTNANITVDADGRITAASNGSAGTGDIEGVTAGDGLQGGGTSGTVTVNATPSVTRGLVVVGDSLGIENKDFGDITVTNESWQIDADAVGSNEIAADAVGSSEISANAVGSSEISTAAVGDDELQNTAVTPGSYTFSSITVDADGRLTAASSGTEVDGSITNEGSLTVGAGTGTTSTIVSNTSGSTAVTIEAGTGLGISETGSTITLTNTQTGLTDGDKGDITVSASGATWNIDADAIGSAEIAANAVGDPEIATAAVGPDELQNTAVTPGSYTFTSLTVDADGRITSASNGTEVDGSISNEGSLTVGAGTGTTSIINSNTSGSTGVTLEAGTGMSISESGNTITLSSTSTGTLSGNGTANYIPYYTATTTLGNEAAFTYNPTANIFAAPGIETTNASKQIPAAYFNGALVRGLQDLISTDTVDQTAGIWYFTGTFTAYLQGSTLDATEYQLINGGTGTVTLDPVGADSICVNGTCALTYALTKGNSIYVYTRGGGGTDWYGNVGGGGGGLSGLTTNYVQKAASATTLGNSLMYDDGSAIEIGGTSGDSKLDITTNSLGVTQTNTSGLVLENETAASAGAQQMSPGLRWRSHGWKTNATAGSQTVDWRTDLLPVQGTSAPTALWQSQFSINGGTYQDAFRFAVNSDGISARPEFNIGSNYASNGLRIYNSLSLGRYLGIGLAVTDIAGAAGGAWALEVPWSTTVNIETEANFSVDATNTAVPALMVQGAGTGTGVTFLVESSSGTDRFRILDNGKVMVGGTSPTATLHIKAGSASSQSAPLKIDDGTLNTTPEAGAIENDGSNMFYTTSGATRYTLVKALTASATLDLSSTASGGYTSATITVTGAAEGDPVALGLPNASVISKTEWFAWVSAADTVTVRFTNNDPSTQDPASGTYKVTVFRN